MTSQRLDSTCTNITDCEHKTAPIDPSGKYFAVGTPAMKGNSIDYEEARRISAAVFDSWTRRLRPRVGDLLLAREAPVGPVVLIPSAENVAPGQRTVLLRPDPSIVESDYLYYLLSSPRQQELLRTKAAGSTVSHLNVADVRSFKLPELPSIPEQRTIAGVLRALDDKITANTKVAQTAEALLETAFVVLRLFEEAGNACSTATLEDLVVLNPAVLRPREAEPVYVNMQKLPVSGISIADWARRPAKGGARFENGDTLLARITPCLENRKTGYVDFLDEGQVALGSTEYIVMRSRSGVPAELSYFIATSEQFRSFAIRHMSGTSGRQRVSAASLAEFKITAPDIDSLEAFGRKSSKLFALIKSQRDENRTLCQLRDALLPQLMSGELRVKDAEKTVEEVL
ncbi:MAG: restriction endonuclease subunit S [Gemmatimonadota bacterium]|nr:restriction endonuclease subunit S [Gemmatimonadota bacterium]